MMLGGIAVTMSRGGWLATGVVLVVLFAWLGWRRRELRLPVALAVAVLALGGIFFLNQSEKARARIENVATEGNPDTAGRRVLWEPALAMWRHNVLLGVGPAQFDVRFPQFRTPRLQVSPGWVHNEYLNLLVDYGVVGAVLATLTLGAFGWGVVRSSKYVERGLGDLGARSSNRTSFFLGAWVGLLGLALHGFIDFDLHIPGIAVTAVLVAALLASHLRFATERFWFTPGLGARLILTVGAAAVIGWMLPVAARLGGEGLALARVVRSGPVTPTVLANLELAARQAPDNPRTAFELGENLRRLSLQGEDAWKDQAQQAVEWFNRSAQLNPYDARVQLALGQTYHWLNQPEAAAAAFQRALALGPNDALIHSTVAWYLLQQGRAAEAKQMAEQTLAWQWWSNDLAREVVWQADQQLKRPTPSP